MSIYGCDITNAEQAARYAPQIKGKVVLITGATPGGLGAEFATHLVRHEPKLVVLTARSQEKLNGAISAISTPGPGHTAPIRGLILDLSSFDSVRRAAEEINVWPETLDVSRDTLGANIHAKKRLLLPKMIAQSRRPRFASVSGNWYIDSFSWDDPNCLQPETYKERYPQTKVLNALFAAAAARRAGSRVDFFSCSPGWVWTGLSRHLSEDVKKQMGFLDEDGQPRLDKMDPLDKGCACYYVAAFDETIAQNDNGGYVAPDSTLSSWKIPACARGEDNENRMWSMTEELLGEAWDLTGVVKATK